MEIFEIKVSCWEYTRYKGDKGETAHAVAGQHFTVHVTVKGKQNLAVIVGNITISATEVGNPPKTRVEFDREKYKSILSMPSRYNEHRWC